VACETLESGWAARHFSNIVIAYNYLISMLNASSILFSPYGRIPWGKKKQMIKK
jgi:hypothetical protein